MRLIAVLLVVVLAGCSTAPIKVFMGDYKAVGEPSMELSDARNYCSEESMKFRMKTPATGSHSAFLMQKYMLSCMKNKGYEPLDIRPEEFADPVYVGTQ